MELAGTKVLVLGLGETGLSMARWLAREGAQLRVADTRAQPPGLEPLRRALPQVAVSLGAFEDSTFVGAELLAISPGIPLADPAISRASARGVEVVGDVELFARALARRCAPASAQAQPHLLAVTGTNGKSTVVALAGAMCAAAGLDCEVAGNIGPAVLDALQRRRESGSDPQAWVLELSSFQLETTRTLEPSAAAMLNLSEDHLDRYRSLVDYAAAKARVFAGSGVQVLNRDDPSSLAMAIRGRRVITFGLGAPDASENFGLRERRGVQWLARGRDYLLPLAEMRLAGLHNAANAQAALALCCGIGLPPEALLDALRAFRGLPHRVELVGTMKAVGAEAMPVRFYDDSKGTNVGATIAALDGLAGGVLPRGARVVLVAGGEGKSQDFSPLAAAVARAARAVVLLGRDADSIERALEGCGVPVERAQDMDLAVARAVAAARPGDAVLLSPACASFDMYRNYRHRGEVYRVAVRRFIDATAD